MSWPAEYTDLGASREWRQRMGHVLGTRGLAGISANDFAEALERIAAMEDRIRDLTPDRPEK
ncbi:MAG: hypothetical protein VW405_02575 [Rhodospirillaceae bacterium]